MATLPTCKYSIRKKIFDCLVVCCCSICIKMANEQALNVLVILELVDSEEEDNGRGKTGNGLREENSWVYQHSTRITNGRWLQGNDEN